ncbi:unnamed protein product [Sphagnum jensenii]|uniref:Uncharacterized protein n=1 Tax=Sphagnum jensenii TaxID=128206 RepID=A0ABP1AVV3_9BRYO
MGERWKGLVQASCTGTASQTRVMASLCLSAARDALVPPESNVVFFVGDRVEGTYNQEIERLSKLETIAAILVSKLGPSVNAWVVEPSHYKGSFACYDNLVPSLTTSGEPSGASYNPSGLPASRACLSLLTNCLSQPKENGFFSGSHHALTTAAAAQPGGDHPFAGGMRTPRMIFLGFSKGGVVLNQLLAELSHFEECMGLRDVESADFWQKESGGSSLLPTTLEEFMRSIIEVHYVDVGLNCQGAYQTDPHVLEGLARAAQVRDPGLLIAFHGTPRQWQDRFRRWVVQEKDRCVGLLQDAACKHGDGKLQVSETFYFAGRRASLQMHFEIIEALIVS